MYALLADLLTLSRVAAAGLLLWLGLAHGADALPAAVGITVLAWTTDQLDGWAARRSATPTQLGPYDFPIDATFYIGILGYMVAADFLPATAAVVFLGLAIVAWFSIRRKAVGVLCLRLVDLYAAGVVFARQPVLGVLLLGWLLALAVLYRRRLAERVPRWFNDIRSVGRGRPEHAPGAGRPSEPSDYHGGPR